MEKTGLELEEILKIIRSREAKRRSALVKSAIVVLFTSTLGLFFSFFQFDNLLGNRVRNPETTLADISSIRSQIQAVDTRLTRMDDLLKGLTVPDSAASKSIERKMLAEQITAMDNRLKGIELAILESPERALSIPLLRKDIADSTKRLEEYRTTSRSEIGRLYEQQKWMLGGIGTVLLAVIGGAITIILRSLSKSKGDDA